MIKSISKIIIINLVLITLAFGSSSVLAYRVETLSNVPIEGDFLVSPTRIELALTDEEVQAFTISITNRLGYDANFLIGAEDIEGSDDEGHVKLLGNQKGNYSIKEHLQTDDVVINVGSGQRANVPVALNLKGSSLDKGYYGAVTVTLIKEGGSNSELSLNSRIAVAVLVVPEALASAKGELVKFDTINSKRLFGKSDIDFHLAYKNPNDVHIRPNGVVKVTNMFGRLVDTVNLDTWMILPKSTRTRPVETELGTVLGKYTYTLSLGVNGEQTEELASISVWIIPWLHFLYILIGIVLVVLILRKIAKKPVKNNEPYE